MSNNSVTFINGTDLPIIIEIFQELCYGIYKMSSKLVKPHDTIILNSSNCEFQLSTNIYDKEIANEWVYAGYTVDKIIGNFRNKPFAQGNYSQMYHDYFQIVYNNDIKTATFLDICKSL